MEIKNCCGAKYLGYHRDDQGPRNDFFLGGARIIRKIRFFEFSKFLLYKSLILAPPPYSAAPGDDILSEVKHSSEIGNT